MEVVDHGVCECDYCKKINELVDEVGEIVDGYTVRDIVTAFCQILSSIGDELPVDNREFAAGIYTTMLAMMEDETNGDCTYN
jgi:hypothetical protein